MIRKMSHLPRLGRERMMLPAGTLLFFSAIEELCLTLESCDDPSVGRIVWNMTRPRVECTAVTHALLVSIPDV